MIQKKLLQRQEKWKKNEVQKWTGDFGNSVKWRWGDRRKNENYRERMKRVGRFKVDQEVDDSFDLLEKMVAVKVIKGEEKKLWKYK